MFDLVAVYTRKHPAHAWQFEAVKPKATAELEAGVNKGFGFSTLLMDVRQFLPKFLDAAQGEAIAAHQTLQSVRPGR